MINIKNLIKNLTKEQKKELIRLLNTEEMISSTEKLYFVLNVVVFIL